MSDATTDIDSNSSTLYLHSSIEKPEPTEEELIESLNKLGIRVIKSHESLDDLFD